MMHGPINIRFLLGKFRSRKCPVSINTRRISVLIFIYFSPSSAYHLISTHACPFQLISPYRSLISPYLTSYHLSVFVPSKLTSFHLSLTHLTASHLIYSHLIPFHFTLLHLSSHSSTHSFSCFRGSNNVAKETIKIKLTVRNKDGKSSLLGYYLSLSEEGTSVLKALDFLTADRAFVAAAAGRQFSVGRTSLSIYFYKIC